MTVWGICPGWWVSLRKLTTLLLGNWACNFIRISWVAENTGLCQPACMQRNFSFLKEDLHGWHGVALPVQQTTTQREIPTWWLNHGASADMRAEQQFMSSSCRWESQPDEERTANMGNGDPKRDEITFSKSRKSFETQLRVQTKSPKSQSNSNCKIILCSHSLPSFIYTLRKHDGEKATGSAVWSASQRASGKTDPEAQSALAAVLYWF